MGTFALAEPEQELWRDPREKFTDVLETDKNKTKQTVQCYNFTAMLYVR